MWKKAIWPGTPRKPCSKPSTLRPKERLRRWLKSMSTTCWKTTTSRTWWRRMCLIYYALNQLTVYRGALFTTNYEIRLGIEAISSPSSQQMKQKLSWNSSRKSSGMRKRKSRPPSKKRQWCITTWMSKARRIRSSIPRRSTLSQQIFNWSNGVLMRKPALWAWP